MTWDGSLQKVPVFFSLFLSLCFFPPPLLRSCGLVAGKYVCMRALTNFGRIILRTVGVRSRYIIRKLSFASHLITIFTDRRTCIVHVQYIHYFTVLYYVCTSTCTHIPWTRSIKSWLSNKNRDLVFPEQVESKEREKFFLSFLSPLLHE